MKKKLIIVLSFVALVGGTFLSGCKAESKVQEVEKESILETPKEGTLAFYEMLSDDLGIIEVYDSSELTLEDLQNRNGKIIIEKIIGVVETSKGDGKVLNCTDPDCYYINYSSVENISIGDVILTYCIYNPDTNYEDDILKRFDYIIDDKELKN